MFKSFIVLLSFSCDIMKLNGGGETTRSHFNAIEISMNAGVFKKMDVFFVKK